MNWLRKLLNLCNHDWFVYTDSDWMYIAECRKCKKKISYMKL